MLQKRSLPYRLAGPPRVHGNGSGARAKAATLETLTASCCYVPAMVFLRLALICELCWVRELIRTVAVIPQPTEACAADRCDKILAAVSNCASAKRSLTFSIAVHAGFVVDRLKATRT